MIVFRQTAAVSPSTGVSAVCSRASAAVLASEAAADAVGPSCPAVDFREQVEAIGKQR